MSTGFFHRFVTFQFVAAASNLIVPKLLTVSARPLSQSTNPLNFPAFSASLPSRRRREALCTAADQHRQYLFSKKFKSPKKHPPNEGTLSDFS